MQHWRLLEQFFTVKSIMTPRESLLTWDGTQVLDDIWEEANSLKIDAIPVVENGQIQRFLQRGIAGARHLTDDWLVTPDTAFPMTLSIFAQQKKQCLFVYSNHEVLGLVTPADFNKLPARTYFYSLMAELEITLAAHIEKREFTDEELYAMLGEDQERQKQIHNKLNESDLELGVVHTLYLSEIVNIIKADESLRKTLKFCSKKQVEKKLNGLVHFRNAIMHPYNLILSNGVGVDKLDKNIQRTIGLLEQWIKDN